MDATGLKKLAASVALWSASLAVFGDHNGLVCWGLVDQELHYANSLNQEPADRFDRPGVFQVSVTAAAELSVFADLVMIGSLRRGRLSSTYHDVFARGPVHEKLAPHVKAFAGEVGRLLRVNASPHDEIDLGAAEQTWLTALCRLLLGIQRYRHGGALILDRGLLAQARATYSISYDRLHDMLVRLVEAGAVRSRALRRVFAMLDRERSMIPTSLYLRERVAQNNIDDCNKGISGSVQFLTALSRTDGAMIFLNGLRLRGFGAEVSASKDVKAVWFARSAEILPGRLQKVPTGQFGMRHRSVFRFCWARPNSVGFIVSQDGDIRVVTRLNKRIVVWEDVRLQDVYGADVLIEGWRKRRSRGKLRRTRRA